MHDLPGEPAKDSVLLTTKVRDRDRGTATKERREEMRNLERVPCGITPHHWHLSWNSSQ